MEFVFPFLVTLREGLEAVLIISVILAYLRVREKQELGRYVWAGVGLGVLGSIAVGGGTLFLYGGLEGVKQTMFEAGASIFAAAVLTSAILWMTRNGGRVDEKIRGQLESSMSKREKEGLLLLAFISVFREGVETVLMLSATAFRSPFSTAVGGTAGIVTGILAGLAFNRESRNLTNTQFFKVVSLLLLFFASGILSYGVHEAVEVGEHYGIKNEFLYSEAYDLTPGENSIMHPEKGVFGAVFSAFLGAMYLSPENITAISYIIYWLIIGTWAFKRLYPEKEVRASQLLPGQASSWAS